MSTPFDLSLDAGESHVATVTVASVNFIGGSAIYAARRGGPRGPIVLEKSSSSGITLANGSLTITFSPADTRRLDGPYWHACSATTAGGTAQTLFTGTLSVQQHGAHA